MIIVIIHHLDIIINVFVIVIVVIVISIVVLRSALKRGWTVWRAGKRKTKSEYCLLFHSNDPLIISTISTIIVCMSLLQGESPVSIVKEMTGFWIFSHLVFYLQCTNFLVCALEVF